MINPQHWNRLSKLSKQKPKEEERVSSVYILEKLTALYTYKKSQYILSDMHNGNYVSAIIHPIQEERAITNIENWYKRKVLK